MVGKLERVENTVILRKRESFNETSFSQFSYPVSEGIQP